jgi:hypothetical protein
VEAALDAIGSKSPNAPAILLLTDGLQNTNPMRETVESALGTVKFSVIGFGSDAAINGPLLSRVAREHGGPLGPGAATHLPFPPCRGCASPAR